MLVVYDIGIHNVMKPIWHFCIGVFSFCLLSWCTCMVLSLVLSYSCLTEFSIVTNYDICINMPIFQVQVWLHVCTVTASFHAITY